MIGAPAASVVHARRSGLLLWLVALFGGLVFAAIHLALIYTMLNRLEPGLLLADAAILALALAAAAWYIRSLTGERQRHAAQVVLFEVLAEPRNIGDAARGALAALTQHRLADAGVIALADQHADEHGDAQSDAQRVVAAVGYPEGWAATAPVARPSADVQPTIRRDREAHPWVEPLGGHAGRHSGRHWGRRPWVARIPITSNGDIIGLLLLVAKRGGALRDPAVLATIAAQVGAALDHAALYEAAYQRERDLEGQDQRRREFLAAISHEIRTPLMAIQAFADLLNFSSDAMGSPAEELLASLTDAVERLNRLVTDLIDLGRSGGEALEVRVSEMDTREALRAAESMMRPAFLLRGQTVTSDVPDAPLYAIADPHRLEQVILAVLANANRHAPPASEIALGARRADGGRIVIEIRDHGAGIAREDRERIFEPYYRVPGVDGESVPGSGLGLAVARRLIEAQGGCISVENCDDGPGARFRIELRAAPERA